jgi:hypothetical protein
MDPMLVQRLKRTNPRLSIKLAIGFSCLWADGCRKSLSHIILFTLGTFLKQFEKHQSEIVDRRDHHFDKSNWWIKCGTTTPIYKAMANTRIQQPSTLRDQIIRNHGVYILNRARGSIQSVVHDQ